MNVPAQVWIACSAMNLPAQVQLACPEMNLSAQVWVACSVMKLPTQVWLVCPAMKLPAQVWLVCPTMNLPAQVRLACLVMNLPVYSVNMPSYEAASLGFVKQSICSHLCCSSSLPSCSINCNTQGRLTVVTQWYTCTLFWGYGFLPIPSSGNGEKRWALAQHTA